jgi:hypothetical protein
MVPLRFCHGEYVTAMVKRLSLTRCVCVSLYLSHCLLVVDL